VQELQDRQKESILKQIAALPNMSNEELKILWRTLIGGDPPAYNRTFIVKHLAHRIQEIHYGGLSERTRAMMTDTLRHEGFDENGRMLHSCRKERDKKRASGMPVIGTRFTREWRDNIYEVIVVPGGFEYAGSKYKSLTAVAQAITGSHWNGKAFFGLKNNSKKGKGCK